MDSTVGALIGLLVSIFLIIKKVSPAYSLILGALIGGLAGGFSLEEVVVSMTEGVICLLAVFHKRFSGAHGSRSKLPKAMLYRCCSLPSFPQIAQ